MIWNLILAGIVSLVLLTVFGCVGMLVMNRVESKSVSLTLILGFFVYFALFQVVALPFKLLLLPLSYLSGTWGIFVITLSILAIILHREKIAGLLGNRWNCIRLQHRWIFVVLGIGTIAIAAFIACNMFQIAQYDAGYYLGSETSSVYTNTIEQYDAYTGVIRQELNTFYLLNTYTMWSSPIDYE